MASLDSQTLFLIIIPALLLSFLAQLAIHSALTKSSRAEGRMSGYAAARHLLDGSGLYDVAVEQVPGQLNNHYDSSRNILQLSPDIYHGRTLAAIGTAAHEAGHAIQKAKGKRLYLFVRNAAVPAASFGSGAGILVAVVGLFCRFPPLISCGILLFSGSVFFQLINLPGEWDASSRVRRLLVELSIVDEPGLRWARKAMNAAALTYLAATLQSILTILQKIVSASGPRQHNS